MQEVQSLRTFSVFPDEMYYHKDRFLVDDTVTVRSVHFAGAFTNNEPILANQVEVVSRGNELGNVARFLVRSGEHEVDLTMDLTTCRYDASGNIPGLEDVRLVFNVETQARE